MILFAKTFLTFLLISFSFAFQTTEKLNYKLIVFEGSDWCANCRRLEKTILSDSNFIHEMKISSIEIERIDFPQRKKLPESIQLYNKETADKYNFEGSFPTLVLLNSTNSVYQKISFSNQTVLEMLNQIKATTGQLK